MAIFLAIETSTHVCSVALIQDTQVIAHIETYESFSHAEKLTTYIEQILHTAKNKKLNIDAIAVSKGPGSYTGLRIGVSTAKGLAFGFNIPIISIDTLQILAQAALAKSTINTMQPVLYCPMIDARRMEVYTTLYTSKLEQYKKTEALIITANTFVDVLNMHTVYFFGDGAKKCQTIIKHQNAVFLPDLHPLAINMAPFILTKYKNKTFENLAYFEPYYLKDFVATKPKKNLL